MVDLTNLKHFDLTVNNPIRLGFADAVKTESELKYGVPANLPDSEKEIRKYIHPDSQELVSARDCWIEMGDGMRLKDEDYWVNRVIEGMKETNGHVVITDWRYPNEYNKICAVFPDTPVTTIRLFRSSVPIPDKHISSERSLDDFMTDILLLSDSGSSSYENEFQEACKIFPQYKNYVTIGFL